MFDRLLTTLAVLLPTLFAVTVELVNRKAKARTSWRLSVIAFGIGSSGITGLQIYRSDNEHTQEVRQRRDEAQGLRTELHESKLAQQMSNSYLKAKLEDEARLFAQLAQIAPGIKTLAETSAEFQRKQYETRVASDKQIYQFTMNTVREIRDFAQKRQLMTDEEIREESNLAMAPGLADSERQRRRDELWEKQRQISHAEEREFHSILSDVLYATTELQKRMISEPAVDATIQKEVVRAFNGSLAGVYPEMKLADYLQAWAKPLAFR